MAAKTVKLRTQLLLGYGVIIIVMVAISTIIFFNVNSLILMDMVNQETGQRGFLLTGLESSLEPYTQGIETFDDHLAELREYISANRRYRRRGCPGEYAYLL